MSESEATGIGMFGPNLEGIRVLSRDEDIPVTQYIRYVLPLDGYVFWLRTASTTIKGSLHTQINAQQREDETFGLTRVWLTTGAPVNSLDKPAPDTIWVADARGVRFAFSAAGPRYEASGLYHYAGDAVYPALESQLVDVGSQLSADTLIVSNSLPMWLALKAYTPFWLAPLNPGITLYPSFLVPDNLTPPYGSVHIDPPQTRALQALATLGPTATHNQLAADHVRITLYGLTNAQSLDFLDLITQYMRDNDPSIGLMSTPLVRDEKRTQVELGIIAMKKTIDVDVSYYQNRMNDIARQLLEQVSVTYFPQPLL